MRETGEVVELLKRKKWIKFLHCVKVTKFDLFGFFIVFSTQRN